MLYKKKPLRIVESIVPDYRATTIFGEYDFIQLKIGRDRYVLVFTPNDSKEAEEIELISDKSLEETKLAAEAHDLKLWAEGGVEAVCSWKLENDGDDYYYNTSCGEDFQLIDGTPKENNYNHCPSCGGSIKSLEE